MQLSLSNVQGTEVVVQGGDGKGQVTITGAPPADSSYAVLSPQADGFESPPRGQNNYNYGSLGQPESLAYTSFYPGYQQIDGFDFGLDNMPGVTKSTLDEILVEAIAEDLGDISDGEVNDAIDMAEENLGRDIDKRLSGDQEEQLESIVENSEDIARFIVTGEPLELPQATVGDLTRQEQDEILKGIIYDDLEEFSRRDMVTDATRTVTGDDDTLTKDDQRRIVNAVEDNARNIGSFVVNHSRRA
jgi:hypothetical protein